MKKEEIEAILMVSKYITICKFHNHSLRAEGARCYLTSKIKKALNKKSTPFWKVIFGVQ
jgi:hypothetical protein